MDNFIEAVSVLEANQVNLDIYRFVTYSDRLGIYIFVKRAKAK